MKVFNFLTITLGVLIFASCTKEPVDAPQLEVPESAYLSLNLLGSGAAATRADGDPEISTGEDKVNDLTILYFNNEGQYIGQSEKLSAANLLPTAGGVQTKEALVVPATTAKVFVVINNFNGATARFTLPTNAQLNTLWNELYPTILVSTTTVENVGELAQKLVTPADGVSNITMANYGVRFTADGAVNSSDNGLIDIKIATTAEAANAITQTGGNIVSIDRLVAKVQFDAAPATTIVSPVDAKFTFLNWEVNATSRSEALYAPHDPNFTKPNGPVGVNVSYRKDATYGVISDWPTLTGAFVYLRNTDGTHPTSTVGKLSGGVAYCPENTMQADAQLAGATTKIVVKGNYTPAKIKDAAGAERVGVVGEHYFTYKNTYYTLEAIQEAYRNPVTGATLIVDFNKFMEAAGLTTGGPIADDVAALQIASDGDTNPKKLNAESGIVAREKNAVRYFHKGVSYYQVLIRHDMRISNPTELGYYGVVRNNWYKIGLRSVSKEGTPWIPGGPDSPIDDPATEEDPDLLMDVVIKINPWVMWEQEVNV